MYNGQGTAYYGSGENGSKVDFYVGEFVDNLRHGQGTYTWSDGDVYVGEWKNGARDGQGTYTWAASGNVVEGTWVDSKKNGILTYTYADGPVIYEQWDNGTLIERRDKDGNLVES